MSDATITLRKATPNDAADLAILDNVASHGMSMAFWEYAACNGEGESPLVIARSRFADPNAIFGWKNAIVAEHKSIIAGSVTIYEMTPPDDEIDWIKQVFPPFEAPFTLFGKAVGDWFVDSLGVYPEARRQGVARMLIQSGLAKGKQAGHKQTALVVESDNEAALALYKDEGFSVVDQLPFLDTEGRHLENREWLLMKRSL